MIIAEIGQNFCGSILLAKKLIELAKDEGADLAKFQLYDYNVLYKDHPEIPNYELTKEQAFELFDYGKKVGIEVFFSVFDVEKVKWCEEMGVLRYKIAFSQRFNRVIIDAIPSNKEIIISCDLEIYHWVTHLYCVPEYPAPFGHIQFREKTEFEGHDEQWGMYFDGFSDHTIGLDVAKIALARGAQIIEKHFSISHDVGIDGTWSMTPDELKELKRWENICKEVL